MALHITGDAAADQVLNESSFALLAGMMLDQQYPMEHAFRGPAKVLERFGSLEPSAIAAADPDEFAALCSTPPAIHRFPGSMATRLQSLAAVIEEKYDGHTERLWTEADVGQGPAGPGDGAARLRQAEGADLRDPAGQAARRPAGRLGGRGRRLRQDGYRSVADVVDPASLQKVRDFKKAKKAGSARRPRLELVRIFALGGPGTEVGEAVLHLVELLRQAVPTVGVRVLGEAARSSSRSCRRGA